MGLGGLCLAWQSTLGESRTPKPHLSFLQGHQGPWPSRHLCAQGSAQPFLPQGQGLGVQPGTPDWRFLESPHLAAVSSIHTSDPQGRAVSWA